MSEDFGLRIPDAGASEAVWLAYRRASEARRKGDDKAFQWALRDELNAKLSPADCQRALFVFQQVLDKAGVDAVTAATGQFKCELWDEFGEPGDGTEPTREEGRAGSAWLDAIEAARKVLCDEPPHLSVSAFYMLDFLGRETAGPAYPLVAGTAAGRM